MTNGGDAMTCQRCGTALVAEDTKTEDGTTKTLYRCPNCQLGVWVPSAPTANQDWARTNARVRARIMSR